MLVLRAIVTLIVASVTLQAQCLAFCSTMACEHEHEHAASEALQGAASVPCQGHSSDEPESSHGAEPRCASLPSEVERAPASIAPVEATAVSSTRVIAPLPAAVHADADLPPVVSPLLRAIHVTVLLI